VSISTSRESIADIEPVLEPGLAGGTRLEPGPAGTVQPQSARPDLALFRLRSAQPSRRAVLHLQAAGDPVIPADLAGWFTERACHFYLVGFRLPGRMLLPGWRVSHAAARAVAQLDETCARLREADGMEHVILSAQGRAAMVAALWCDRQSRGGPTGQPQLPVADALILYQPAWPARPALRLNIGCPVLALSGQPASARLRLTRQRPAPHLGDHVTWRRLPEATDLVSLPGPGRRAFFDELGRWLGAYMYGLAGDTLL
jgi:hypothetical protein